MRTAGASRSSAERPPLVLLGEDTTRASIVVAGSFLLSTVLSASLGLLIGVVLGETPETDALLAAYSLYLVFTLFGTNLRVALVPILGSTHDEEAYRRRSVEVVGRLASLGAVVSLALLVASVPLGRLLTVGSADSEPGVAAGCLALLAVAVFCQIAAAAMAAVLAGGRRFTASATLYVAASATTVAAAGLLMVPFDAIGAAAGVLLGAGVLVAGHAVLLHRHGISPVPLPRLARDARTWRMGGAALGGAGVPLANQFMLVIALSLVPGVVGTVTAYSYAYFVAVLLSAITAASIGFTTMPGLVADLVRRPDTAAADYLRSVSPIGVLLFVPAAAATGVFGRPVLAAVLEGPLEPDTIDLLWDLLRVFLGFALVWVLLTPIPTIGVSLHRFRAMALISGLVLPLDVCLVLAVRSAGVVPVAVAHGAMTLALLLAIAAEIFGRRTPAILGSTVRACARPVLLGATFPLVGLLVPHDAPAAAIGLAAVGLALYAGLALLVWPAVTRPLARQVVAALRP